jgi:hypothetical protein
MPRTEKYFVGPGLLSDIRQTITRVAGMPDKTKGAAFRVGNTEALPRPGGKVFRVCTFTGSWNINAAKTVTFRGVTTTPNTVAAVNLFATIAAPTGTASCAIARDGTAWYVIAAQCS